MASVSHELRTPVAVMRGYVELLRDGTATEPEEVELCQVVSDAVRAIRRTAQSKQIIITSELPDKECIVKGDYGRIRQMLVILLDNAVKFSGEKESVKILLTCENDYVILVIDHGVGISEKQLPHIF